MAIWCPELWLVASNIVSCMGTPCVHQKYVIKRAFLLLINIVNAVVFWSQISQQLVVEMSSSGRTGSASLDHCSIFMIVPAPIIAHTGKLNSI